MAINVFDPYPVMPWRFCQVLTTCPLTGELAYRPCEGLIVEGVMYRRVHAPEAAASADALRDMALHLCEVAGQRLPSTDGPCPSAGASPSGGREGEKSTIQPLRSIPPEPFTLWSA